MTTRAKIAFFIGVTLWLWHIGPWLISIFDNYMGNL